MVKKIPTVLRFNFGFLNGKSSEQLWLGLMMSSKTSFKIYRRNVFKRIIKSKI